MINQIVKTDKITVHYAKVPGMSDLRLQFMMKIVGPIELAGHTHEYFRISAMETFAIPEGAPHVLKKIALKRFHELLEETLTRENDRTLLFQSGMGWLYDIEDAEMVECDFMVPKEKR